MRDNHEGTKTRDGLPIFMPPQPVTRFILDPETLVFPAAIEDAAAAAAGDRLVSSALGSSPSPSPAPGASSSSSSLNGAVVGDATLMPKAKVRLGSALTRRGCVPLGRGDADATAPLAVAKARVC